MSKEIDAGLIFKQILNFLQLSLSQNPQQMNCKCFKAARQSTAEKSTKATFEYPFT